MGPEVVDIAGVLLGIPAFLYTCIWGTLALTAVFARKSQRRRDAQRVLAIMRTSRQVNEPEG
jgi:hypothetical protein